MTMKKYRLPRDKAPLRPWPAGAKIVGGNDTHAFVELPDDVDPPEALEPFVIGHVDVKQTKKGRKATAEALEDQAAEDG